MQHKIHYEVKGKERKQLAQLIGELLNQEVRYEGVPSFDYRIGNSRLDKNGTLIPDPELLSSQQELLYERLQERGYAGELVLEDGMKISVPRELFKDGELDNLRRIVKGKNTLMKHAFQKTELEVITEETKVSFPWFPLEADAESVVAYTTFVTKLCDFAKKQQRILMVDKETDNEKYAFRCFLIRLGLIGTEYKEVRKVLLKNLEGNSAFRHGK